ncbi:MAG: trehalose-6-phosphate synthase [Planctomycetota bacterium]
MSRQSQGGAKPRRSENRSAEAGRLVVVANRLPVRQVGGTDEKPRWRISPGGLVTALAPMLRERGGTWVGWAGDMGRTYRPFTQDGIRCRPVALEADLFEGFYQGFSNSTLWPLYHDAVRPPEFHRHWWRPYVEANERFAKAAAGQVKDGDIVWVHDYQLQLVPRMIRELKPETRIGFFNHIPFPPEELFAQLPWRRSILEGLLGADVIGFQTKQNAQNFSRAARRHTSARGSDTELVFEGRRVQSRAFPISIDTADFERSAASEEVVARAKELRALMAGRKVILGVDRLDYTKGIDIRFRSFEEALRRKSVTAENSVLVQIAVPSRADVGEYVNERDEIERLVGRINGTYGQPGKVAVHYLYRSVPREELLAFYLASDVLMVTPFRDGMNLVAKEYVATRLDDTGVLVLSEFAGAAHELRGAILVNPHDIDGMADALEQAISLPDDEATRRMAAMRRVVRRHDVYRWSDSFLDTLIHATQPNWD